MKTNNKHKAHAFWGAAFVLLIAMGCTQPTDGNTGGTVTPNPDAPFIEGGASLILSPDKLTIGVTAVTSDGSAVAVLKGNIIKLYCYNNQLTALNVQGLTALQRLDCYNNQLTALNVQGLTALQKLDCYNNQLTELNVQDLTALQSLSCSYNQLTALDVQGLTALQGLDCYNNQLTALNVQGCTALNTLWCYSNKLNADAFKKLFDDLPARQDSDDAKCYLYTEETGVTEGNHTDFTSPSEVQTAFENAKDVKHWKMYKRKMNGLGEEI